MPGERGDKAKRQPKSSIHAETKKYRISLASGCDRESVHLVRVCGWKADIDRGVDRHGCTRHIVLSLRQGDRYALAIASDLKLEVDDRPASSGRDRPGEPLDAAIEASHGSVGGCGYEAAELVRGLGNQKEKQTLLRFGGTGR